MTLFVNIYSLKNSMSRIYLEFTLETSTRELYSVYLEQKVEIKSMI